MGLKGKAFAILLAVIVLVGAAFAFSFNKGFTGVIGKNPLKTSASGDLSQLYRDAKFEFMLPNIVTDGTFGELKSAETISGSLVQISMEHATFWAAPFVDYNADPSGDYTEYPIDNKYITPDKTFYVRYRSNEVDKTLLFIKWDSVAYSLVMDSVSTQDELLPKFGIDINNFVEFTEEIINNQVEDDINNANLNNETQDNTNDTLFATYKNEELGIQFMFPIIGGQLEMVQSNRDEEPELMVMVNSKVVLVISHGEYSNTKDSENETVLDDEWKLTNLGNTYDSLDSDQIKVIDNLDTIISTFSNMNIKE